MQNVYKDSYIDHEKLAKYPEDGEHEMLASFAPDVDVSGEVLMSKELFHAWLRFGPAHGECSCAEAILHYAQNLQSDDMRSAVGPDTAWELCCRELTLAVDTTSIGSRTMANFIMWLLDGDPEGVVTTAQLPTQMRYIIYEGMEDDLHARGKEIRTDQDEHAMKTRWVKQKIHREFDVVREAWLAEQPEAPVDLAVSGAIDEAEHGSVTKDAEDEAKRILAGLEDSKVAQIRADMVAAAEQRDFVSAAALKKRLEELENAAPPSEQTPSKRKARDVPLVDPPEYGERVSDLYNKEPLWIPAAFPTIFQNETGDPYDAPEQCVDLNTWGPHVMRSKGWAAQAHTTFMYWWMNFIQRIKVLGAKQWYIKDNPDATGYTVEDLKKMGPTKLAKQMGSYTQNIPGTKASKAKLRRLLLAMVRQIEIETKVGRPEDASAEDTDAKLGDVPCVFGTLGSQRYNWDDVIRIIAQVEGYTGDEYKGAVFIWSAQVFLQCVMSSFLPPRPHCPDPCKLA